MQALCLVLRCLSDVLEGSSFIAVWSVSYFVMLLKNFVGVIYQSLRKVCATSGPFTSTRTCFVLNGSRCLIELTHCGRKSNQPSSVAWPLFQPTRCGRKTNQPSSVAWWPLCQPTRCSRSNRDLKIQRRGCDESRPAVKIPKMTTTAHDGDVNKPRPCSRRTR